MDNYELFHWGIKGMKWGLRRFQNKDGSLTKAGRKRYGEDESQEETSNQRKDRIMKSPSAKDVYENRTLFSNKEINDLYQRLNNETNIKRMIPEDVSRGKQIVDKYVDTSNTIKNVMDATNNLFKSYETGKKIVDAFMKSVSD